MSSCFAGAWTRVYSSSRPLSRMLMAAAMKHARAHNFILPDSLAIID